LGIIQKKYKLGQAREAQFLSISMKTKKIPEKSRSGKKIDKNEQFSEIDKVSKPREFRLKISSKF
jgi:hypothetical protein